MDKTASSSNIASEISSLPGFIMKLGNGEGWEIIATDKLRPWTSKLASIMRLKPSESNGYSKLIFMPRQSEREACQKPKYNFERNIRESLRDEGWELSDNSEVRLWSHHRMPDMIFEIKCCRDKRHSIFMMHVSLHPIYRRAQDSGGLPFHGALVARDGMGILLGGRGGVGKSTCCRRIKGPWVVLCDEEALVVHDERKQYLVHAFPTWSDHFSRRCEHTWNVQQHFPLSTIFFLEQDDTDEVRAIGRGQAAILITQAAMQIWRRIWISMDYSEDISFKNTVFENACKLARTVPSYLLRVSLRGRFWEKIEAVLK